MAGRPWLETVTVDGDPGPVSTYQYDDNGNRTLVDLDRTYAGGGTVSLGGADIETDAEDRLKKYGAVTCWGFGIDFRSPPAGTALRQVAAGPVGTCGILADGVVDCWAALNDPALLEPPAGQFVEVTVGANNACAVRSDGDAVCWPEIGGTPQPQGLKVLLD